MMRNRKRQKQKQNAVNEYPRCHYNHDRTPKRKFATAAEAYNFIELEPMMNADRYEVYLCNVCNRYHLATKPEYKKNYG